MHADYNRLLKYGDSLYRCKELKRAAMVRPRWRRVLPAGEGGGKAGLMALMVWGGMGIWPRACVRIR